MFTLSFSLIGLKFEKKKKIRNIRVKMSLKFITNQEIELEKTKIFIAFNCH